LVALATLPHHRQAGGRVKVFLTGGTGYIGGAVLRCLRANGHDVTTIVRSEDAARVVTAAGSTSIVGDLREPDRWRAAAASADAIVHAAQPRLPKRVGRAWVKEARSLDARAVASLLEAASAGKRCRSFVLTSGVSAFGDHGADWIDEATVGSPSELGQKHLAAEAMALAAARDGLPVCVLRPSLPYGPAGTFAEHFLRPGAEGRLDLVGNGHNFFPCVHLEDLASAYLRAVVEPPVGEIIAVVDDDPLTMRGLTELVLQSFNGGRTRSGPRWLVALLAGAPLANMLVESYRVRNGKARSLLRWQPTWSTAREGLPGVVREYLGHGRSHGPKLAS
jgi:nucleoside-diphosphate-sugar epimerase